MSNLFVVLFAMIYAPDRGGSGAPIYCYNLMTKIKEESSQSGIIFSAHYSYLIPKNAFWSSYPILLENPPIFDNQPQATNSIPFRVMSKNQIQEYINKFVEGFEMAIKTEPYNIIHVQHGMYIGYAASIIKQKLKIPYIVTLHIMELNFIHEFPDPILALKAMTDADRIIALTEAQKQRLIKEYKPNRIIKLEMQNKKISKAEAIESYKKIIGSHKIIPENIVVCPLGIDTKLFSLEDNPDTPDDLKFLNFPTNQKIVYFAGRLIELKGIHYLLKAEKIYNAKKDTHTIIIGGGDLANLVRDCANKNPFIHYLGFKDQKEMPDYHNYIAKHNAVFCVPSRSEGLSLVYLEAMCSGLPVVGCCKKDMGDLDFMQKPYAELVTFGDVNALGKLLLKKLNNRQKPIRTAYRSMVEKYNLQNMYTSVKNIYKSVLDIK